MVDVEDYGENTQNESDPKKGSKAQKKKWKWSDDMIKDLIDALKNYKSVSEYNSIHFSADKVKLYEEVRKLMSVSHGDSFGLIMATPPAKPTKDMSKSEYDHYKKNYDRELDEIKVGYKRVK
jgi:CO dehydrogenase/acetyl-CoA synthase delta subunit